MPTIWMTIVYPIRDREVLLSKKTRKIGEGKWNGFGGKVENETIRQAAVRELKQESGLFAEEGDLEKVAICTFLNTKENGEAFEVKCVIFLVRKWQGEICVNDEMKNPTWFPIDNLPPKEEFMAADLHWLPLVLEGKLVTVLAKYDANWSCPEKPLVHIVPRI